MTASSNWVFFGVRVVREAVRAENASIDKVSSLVAGTLAKRGLARHALASLAIHRVNGWLRARFPVGAAAAKAVRIADGVLAIECGHSIVLQELQLQMADLMAFIAAECPFAGIESVRLSRADGDPGNALAPGNPPA